MLSKYPLGNHFHPFFFKIDRCSVEGKYLCRNGGVCTYNHQNDEFVCVCPESYEGNYCETGNYDLSRRSISNPYNISCYQYVFDVLIGMKF